MGILLTDEEARNLCQIDPDYISGMSDYLEYAKDIEKAQLKKVVEWGDEPCPHKPYDFMQSKKRRECSYCWQALLKEVE